MSFLCLSDDGFSKISLPTINKLNWREDNQSVDDESHFTTIFDNGKQGKYCIDSEIVNLNINIIIIFLQIHK